MRAIVAIASVTVALAAQVPVNEGPRDIRLESGSYVLMITADSGTKQGSRLRANVELVKARSDDRSPQTGERADLPLWLTPLYGWTDGDLKVVGAPVSSGPHEPSPSSRDPIHPGILVHAWQRGLDEKHSQPVGAQVLTISSLSNGRTLDSLRWFDGGGIGLFVQGRDADCYYGSWSNWGIIGDGTGKFRLCCRVPGRRRTRG
jgi:hypothetical protein